MFSPCRRLRSLALALAVLGFAVPAFAGADLSGCVVNKKSIETVTDENATRVAQARLDGGRFVIVANPYFSQFGWEALRWLYLRECGHIALKHDITARQAGKSSPREESEADCWAIEWMRNKEKLDSRDVRTIERDLERLTPRDWLQFLGPKRRIDLAECLRK